MNNNRYYRFIFSLICLLLVLVYASTLFIPHCHQCEEEACVVCNLIKSFGCIGVATGLYFILSLADNSVRNGFGAFREAMILHDSVPVWLKVKLSN